jgi:hypothetical protein
LHGDRDVCRLWVFGSLRKFFGSELLTA